MSLLTQPDAAKLERFHWLVDTGPEGERVLWAILAFALVLAVVGAAVGWTARPKK